MGIKAALNAERKLDTVAKCIFNSANPGRSMRDRMSVIGPSATSCDRLGWLLSDLKRSSPSSVPPFTRRAVVPNGVVINVRLTGRT